jgi:hypothetical protein
VIAQQEGHRSALLWQAGAVDLWMATFYHRLPLLHPRLQKIGLGYAEARDFRFRAVVLDVLSSVSAAPAAPRSKIEAVIFPADKQKSVPCLFDFGSPEVPNPIPDNGDAREAGYPITVAFPEDAQVENVEVIVKGARGKEVPAWVSTPVRPALPSMRQPGTICAITKGPLRPSTTYAVTVSATVNGTPWSRTWRFTTGLR